MSVKHANRWQDDIAKIYLFQEKSIRHTTFLAFKLHITLKQPQISRLKALIFNTRYNYRKGATIKNEATYRVVLKGLKNCCRW